MILKFSRVYTYFLALYTFLLYSSQIQKFKWSIQIDKQICDMLAMSLLSTHAQHANITVSKSNSNPKLV